MKKFVAILLIITLLLMFFTIPAFARAGGGGGGGGGGGFRIHRYYRGNNNADLTPAASLIVLLLDLLWIAVLMFSIFSSIFLSLRFMRRHLKTKRVMKMLSKEDSTWKYKGIIKRITKAYYIIQYSWSRGTMKDARTYMSQELYDEFQKKLDIMKRDGERNVLEKIKLKDIMPISLHDSDNNLEDYLWVKIKGSMVDYIINSEIRKPLPGADVKKTFIEYWQFTRTPYGEWVLNKILQQDELNKIFKSEKKDDNENTDQTTTSRHRYFTN